MGTLHEDQFTFWLYLSQFFLEWEMFQTKICRENQHTRYVFNNFSPQNRAVYKVMWKNIVEPVRT